MEKTTVGETVTVANCFGEWLTGKVLEELGGSYVKIKEFKRGTAVTGYVVAEPTAPSLSTSESQRPSAMVL